MDTLLGAYGDSDDETPAAAAVVAPQAVGGDGGGAAPQAAAQGKADGRSRAEASAPSAPAQLRHRPSCEQPSCECEACDGLLARFVAKSLQTKGIRFKCRLCGDMMMAKAAAAGHFQSRHGEDLQSFKQQKAPKLFQAQAAAQQPAAPKISFARDDILRKRTADGNAIFGGWAKKEKPEPPPCERPEQQHEAEPILTLPPWANATRPSDEDASMMDKEVDAHIAQAQIKRFAKRNVLEVNPTSVRCKLCFKIIGTLIETEKHVVEAHQEDFEKEMGVWERFLFTTCKRQPPFGWVCKVCNIFFPSDGAVWRHLGKEVFVRREERHRSAWQEKEDRWGHAEDEECCGDGMNVAGGLSYESVKRFNEAARREAAEMEAKEFDAMGPKNKPDQESEEEADAPEPAPEDVGKVKFIQEF